jgi:hypothetical protein
MRNLSLSAETVTSFQSSRHVSATAVDLDAGVLYVALERQNLDADVEVEISKIDAHVSIGLYFRWVSSNNHMDTSILC